MRSFTAYLNDPAAVFGPGPLLRQMRAIDDAAARLGGRIAAYAVDSGKRFEGQRTGDALLRLLAGLNRGDEVLVESVGRLAADDEAIDVVVGTFALLGIGLVEAGSLDGPEREVVGLAGHRSRREDDDCGSAGLACGAPRLEDVG